MSSVRPASSPWAPLLEAKHLVAEGSKPSVLQRASQDSFSQVGAGELAAAADRG